MSVYNPDKYAPPGLAVRAANSPPVTVPVAAKASQPKMTPSEHDMIDHAATQHSLRQVKESPNKIEDLQKALPQLSQAALFGGQVDMPTTVMSRDRNVFIEQCKSVDNPNDKAYHHQQILNQTPVATVKPFCGMAGTELDEAFASSEWGAEKDEGKETVGHFADPVTGNLYEMQMDIPPPSDGEYHVNRDNARLNMLEGRPLKTGPKKEVSFAPNAGNPQMGEAEFSNTVIDRSLSYERANTFFNRDGDQDPGEMDRYPVGYTGFQDQTPHTNRLYYVAPTQRGCLSRTSDDMRTNVPEDAPSGVDFEGAEKRHARVHKALKRNKRSEVPVASRAAPDAATVQAPGVVPIQRESKRHVENIHNHVSAVEAPSRQLIHAKSSREPSAHPQLTSTLLNSGRTELGGTVPAAQQRNGKIEIPLTAAGLSRVAGGTMPEYQLVQSKASHDGRRVERQSGRVGQHDAHTGITIHAGSHDRTVEEVTVPVRHGTTTLGSGHATRSSASRVLTAVENLLPLSRHVKANLQDLQNGVIRPSCDRTSPEVTQPGRVHLPDQMHPNSDAATPGAVSMLKRTDAARSGGEVAIGMVGNLETNQGVVAAHMSETKPEDFSTAVATCAHSDVGKAWDPSGPVEPKAKSGKFIHNRDPLLSQRLNPNQFGAEVRPDAVFAHHPDRTHDFRDVELYQQRQPLPPVTPTNLPRLITPSNSVPSTPLRV